MAMSSGSEMPSKRWNSLMTSSSGLKVSLVPVARSLPSTTRKSSVKPRRVRPSTAHATVRYSALRSAVLMPLAVIQLDGADQLTQPGRQLGILTIVDRHVDDRRAGLCQGLCQHGGELPRRLHAVAPCAEGP